MSEKIQSVTKTVEEVVDIICDGCGESCTKKGSKLSPECMELTAYWGFYSKKDGQTWTAHLCEKCVDEKLGFINFNKENYLGSNGLN